MKITKFGHCCLLIEENGVRILTDPGNYTTQQTEVKNIDIVLITHEHGDHFHVESLKTLLQNNPQAKVITNTAVGKLLAAEGIEHSIIEDSQNTTEKEILIEGFGKDHAVVYSTIPVVQNTGYFIANKFFYPGDAFVNPGKAVQILALPVGGPWMKMSEAVDYALEIKADITFPVHDGIFADPKFGGRIAGFAIGQALTYEVLELGKEYNY